MKQATGNDYYYVTAFHDGSCPGDTAKWLMHPVIGRMDSMGHTTALRYYALNSGRCDGIGSDLEITGDRSVLAWGRWPHCMLLKVDSALNLQWARSFNAVGQFEFVKELPGGDLLAGINTDTAAAVLARFGPGGDLLWCKSYFRPGGRMHDAVVGPDSSIMVVGYTDHRDQLLPASFQPKLFLMKVDGQGEVFWCRGYQNNSNRWYSSSSYDSNIQVRSTPTGDLVLLATLGNGTYNVFHRPMLMKTDPNGDTLWTRSVSMGDNSLLTQDLLLCADGGIAFSGEVWGDLPLSDWSGMGYIYKTDSLGHFPCREEHYPVQAMELFPVDSAFTLTSIDGAIAFPAFVNDTVYEVFPDFDACEPGMRIPDRFTKKTRPTIHPNPTTGRFTIAFPDPLTADSFYSVYDAVGRLLFQRPLAKGQEREEIDLSRYGKGTYVVRVTSKDGVCNERVVVQ